MRNVDRHHDARHRARNLAGTILTAIPATSGMTADELRAPYRQALLVGMEVVLQGFHPTAIVILV